MDVLADGAVGENIWKTSRFRVDRIGFVASNTMHSPKLARRRTAWQRGRFAAVVAAGIGGSGPRAKAPLPGSVCQGILVLVVTADNHVAAQHGASRPD